LFRLANSSRRDGVPSMKVFLSSTFEDLALYREHLMTVLDGCETIYRGMEFFGATETAPLDTCLSNLASCDLVVALIGTRYGTIPDGNGKSFTHLELERALASGKPVWAYFLDEEHTPVFARHVETGPAAEKLSALKKWLVAHVTPERFTSPENLGMKLARDLHRRFGDFGGRAISDSRLSSRYRECAYDGLAAWYDAWYEEHWTSDQPLTTICSIASTYFESSRGHLKHKRVLDVACGTGNTFAAFTRAGFETWGTDGSMEMLLKARENCSSAGIETSNLVMVPINWTDQDRFSEQFAPRSFDIIVNTSNSFCHIPPVDQYMQTALANFFNLLKPGGLLFIDTKRYIRTDGVQAPPLLKELRYIAKAKEWVERVEREETRELPGFGAVKFNTRIVNDFDPAFPDRAVQRALIIITIFGDKLPSRTLVVPYYPLPAVKLESELHKAGFDAAVHRAHEGLNSIWKYDFVVGQRPENSAG
jgi:SAM-dependent methyltransferase